mgnify:CR=1 FL=1
MVVQALLTFSVVGFCAYELNRCPTDIGNKVDGSGVYDTPGCPRALYTNMITAAVASWFPAPFYSMVQIANSSVPDERQPTSKGRTLAKSKEKELK